MSKWGWTSLIIAFAILGEVLVYFFWPIFISLTNSGISAIAPGGYHNMIIAFLRWVRFPLFLMVPGIAIATIVSVWRQTEE
jgi:hypothetical protein